ncbi:DUF6150 family protein [Reichenbachiella sp. MALMAid0571]|uniref:DUF6150 family protein n=1 Tax=Reichenbachiella sp. MALMAid0571 TaxID=3143939 RepID=UPI0032E03570
MLKTLFYFIAFCGIIINTGSTRKVYDPCKIFGVVYVEKNPRYAHFKVYEESSEAFADILIFEEENRLYADKQGLWSFTDKKEFADFYIYWEKQKGLADFSVYFTDFESFAGCNK